MVHKKSWGSSIPSLLVLDPAGIGSSQNWGAMIWDDRKNVELVPTVANKMEAVPATSIRIRIEVVLVDREKDQNYFNQFG